MAYPLGKPNPNGGRKKGAIGKKTADMIEAVEQTGLTPLQYLLQVMRDTSKDEPVRIDAAKAAAPYVHPRLAQVELGNKDGKALRVALHDGDSLL
jgi:hypothetical protein